MRRTRRGREEAQLFGPGTDLSISLFAIMAVGFVWMFGIRDTLAGELELSEIEVGRLSTASDTSKTETETLKNQLDLYSLIFDSPAAARRILAEHKVWSRAKSRWSRERRAMRTELDKAEAELSLARRQATTASEEAGLQSARYLALQAKVLQPVPEARLRISVNASLAEGEDIDLYVQTPRMEGAVASYTNPRIFKDSHRMEETGVLVLSEDFKRIADEDQESFLSTEIEESRDSPYLIGCMIRRNDSAFRLINRDVKWAVEVLDPQTGLPTRTRAGTATIKYSGSVYKNTDAATPSYTGLVLIAAADVSANNIRKVELPLSLIHI